jgi:hypothetical protein
VLLILALPQILLLMFYWGFYFGFAVGPYTQAVKQLLDAMFVA